MAQANSVTDDNFDDSADAEIDACMSLESPKSFFLFAGAGSGKTKSLVSVTNAMRERLGGHLRLHRQRIGIITYTNAACDEIKRRLNHDPVVEVSTIHSFVWSLIKGFHADTKQWVSENLKAEIAELEREQLKGKPGSKAAIDREKSIESKTQRLSGLKDIRRFTYNPNGDNRGRDSLNHAEVIKIGSEFLTSKPLMQEIFTSRFPFLLIDESQDTNRHLMEAFLAVQDKHKRRFAIGLLGDTMQRIYGDGKPDLGQGLPKDWATPAKKMNHRCPLRVIQLINKIRSDVDGQTQRPRSDKEEGHVRLFLLSSSTTDKLHVEKEIREKMAKVTGDPLWSGAGADTKTLIIEHHMAARRMGFLPLFETLYIADSLRTGLLDGTIPELRFFSQLVLPLVKASESGSDFTAAAIVRKYSPLLAKPTLREKGKDQKKHLQMAKSAVESLMKLWDDEHRPSFSEVLRNIAKSNLFEIPNGLKPIALRTEGEQAAVEGSKADSEGESPDPMLDIWDKFLESPFAQIEAYDAYVGGRAAFGTHQGVKGLEYPRVMVIVDDTEARGFLFNYDKLLGAKGKSASDIKNESEGKETTVDRTRRLFYVTCSRAEKSLAIVVYSESPAKVREHVISEGWFEDREVEQFL